MTRTSRLHRRQFLKCGARASAVAGAAPYVVASSALGNDGATAPSERIGMGFIGVGNQGGGHLLGGAWTYLPGGYVARGDVQVLAVSDVERGRRERAVSEVQKRYAERAGRGSYRACEGYVDFRELLARDDVDAVLIGSPIHWHAMMTILAAKAGKDVYCEKPTAVTLRESRAMADAVRRYGRVYQAGAQQRSEYEGRFRRGVQAVRGGVIGKLKHVYAYMGGAGFAWRPSFGEYAGPSKDFHGDLRLGPAPGTPPSGMLGAHHFGWGSINWGQYRC